MTGIEAPVADWVTISDLHRDPFPIYDRLRAEGGVHWVPEVNRYLVTSYRAVHETELDQELFSANEAGSLQIRAMGHSMLRRDDPEHYVERRAWQPALRPGAVKREWTKVFRRNAERYLDELVAKGTEGDLIWDFAAPYAAENLRELIGLHNADQADLQRWSQTMIDATGNYADDPEIWALGKQSFDEVDLVLDEMLSWHAAHLEDNPTLIAQLLRAPDELMPLDRIRANMKMTIGGGLNEPRDALGVAAWALLRHPEQRDAVLADPSLWQRAFDETIRWVAPIGMYSRQVTRDTVLEGVRLPAGARLGVCILSANRDTEVWRDADKFDIHREVQPHLAFGKGVHVCLGAWVARAEVADVGLPELFSRLDGLSLIESNPPVVAGWVFRGMTKMPVSWENARPAGPAADSPGDSSATGRAAARISIVGSGPAGSFTAQALLKAMPAAQIDVIEAQPVPFGLVRYGVAGDHQGTKSVSRQFDRVYQDPRVNFHGNVRLGVDVSLDRLRASSDAVVLATGVHDDALLTIPGSDLPGVLGAGAVTRALNAHPDSPEMTSLGRAVAIIGHGNVAMDVARLISRQDFEGSDIDDLALETLAGSVRVVHLIGRSAPASAKFDPVMVRELASLGGVQHVVHGVDFDSQAEGKDARLDAVRALRRDSEEEARVRIEWWFEASPVEIVGESGVTGLTISAAAGGEAREHELPVDSVITAIGFVADPDSAATLPVKPGEYPGGRVEAGLYVAGWLRRGARGTIPDQREDSKQLARQILEDLSAKVEPLDGTRSARFSAPAHAVDFTGWRRIDLRERIGAAPGRVRAKLRDREEQLAAARDTSLELPSVSELSHGAADFDLPVSIVYATESGGAELVAEDLCRRFGAGSDARLLDIADIDPSDLRAERFYLMVCSTYGDGELPTSARGFHGILTEEGPDLSGVRYAVFGMGDRSYTRTYSRGSELLDEALASCGAARVGEYGRHDAGGPIEAVEVAVDWLEGVLAEALRTRTAAVAPA